MKINKYILSIAAMGFAFALTPCLAGPGVFIGGPSIVIRPPAVVVAPPPPPVVVAPAPVVTATVAVAPDNYVWDGSEYVGMVGGQYYYLGPGNVWVAMDPVRLHRFNVWMGAHPDWHSHYIHNVNYRGNYNHDHPAPMHDSHPDYDHQDNHNNDRPPQ